MSKFQEKALVWFRRDLRDSDHVALYHALKAADETGAASRGSDLIVKHGVASSEILQLAQARQQELGIEIGRDIRCLL